MFNPSSLLLIGSLLFAPLVASASGSYSARPPRPPTPSTIDADKYNLGKHIFSGQAELGQATADKTVQQSPRLKELQNKLPKAAQKNADLPGLAGKLSPAQLSALEYYLEVRYKVK
jgi:hypothetical protein